MSRSYGVFVAAIIKIPLLSDDTPCICTNNSVFIRFAPSESLSDLDNIRQSISSIKIMFGFLSLAIINRFLIKLSESPWYLDVKSEKNADCEASPATASAIKPFPVPGGCKK